MVRAATDSPRTPQASDKTTDRSTEPAAAEDPKPVEEPKRVLIAPNDSLEIVRKSDEWEPLPATSAATFGAAKPHLTHGQDVPSFRAAIDAQLPPSFLYADLDPGAGGGGGEDPPTSPPVAPDGPGLDPGPYDGTPPTADPPSISRTEQLQQFIDELGKDTTSPAREADKLADALAGKSDLGPLNIDEQRTLIDGALARWMPDGDAPTNYNALRQLGERAKRDPSITGVVAQSLGARAAALWGAEGNVARGRASSLAAAAGMAVANSPANARLLIESLGRSAPAFIHALELDGEVIRDGGSAAYGSPTQPAARVFAARTLLDAAHAGPVSDAGRALIESAFTDLKTRAYEMDPDLAASMGNALAATWYPDDPARAASEGARFGGILATKQGRELLAGDAPIEGRIQALELLVARSEWDASFLKKTSSAYDNPELMKALAAPRARDYGTLRSDTPVTLSGTDLENTIGFAVGFPPQVPGNESIADRDRRERAAAEGSYSYFQGSPAGDLVNPIAEAIRRVGGPDPQVTVIPVQYASKSTGQVELPLFRVQDPQTGADKFVDNEGRIYQSFEQWKRENRLPPGNMTYPANGHLSAEPRLESRNTPLTVDTPPEYLKVGLDNAALVGGIVAGGAILLGSGGILAPAVVAGATLWSGYRSAEALDDRRRHGQTLNPFDSSEARNEWLNLSASALGLVATGPTTVASRFARGGSALSRPAATAAAYLRVGANGIDAAAVGSAGFDLATQWDRLSPAERANLALSAGFWGVSAGAGTKKAGAAAREMFSPSAIREGILFDHLPPSTRALVDEHLAKHSGATRDILTDLAIQPGFSALPFHEQSRLFTYVGGTNKQISEPAREALKKTLLDDPGFKNGDPLWQAERLRRFMERGDGLSWIVQVPKGTYSQLTPYTLQSTGSRPHNFAHPHIAQTAVDSWEMTIDGRKVTFHQAQNRDPSLTYPSITEMTTAFAALPKEVRDQIDVVEISPVPNPDDAYWQQVYGPGGYSSMTADMPGRRVTVYPAPPGHLRDHDELTATLVHESGHILGNAKLGWYDYGGQGYPQPTDPRWQQWQAAMQQDGIPTSIYPTRSNMTEDFAETVRLYFSVRGKPEEAEIRAIYSARFALLEQLFGP